VSAADGAAGGPADPGFESLFDLLPIGAYRSTVDGRQLRANPALVRLNGYASEAELLASVRDIAREWYADPVRRVEFMRLMQRDGQVTDFVSEAYRHRTRKRIWVRENAHVVRDAAGAAAFYEGTVEDITPQRRAELALGDSERRYRAFVEKSQVLTLLIDEKGLIGYASPAAQRLLGVLPEAMLGTDVFDWAHPDDRDALRAELGKTIGFTNSGEESVCRARHADGSWRHLALLANNCLGDAAVSGVVVNARDVSGRMRAEEALRRLNAELESHVQRRTRELEQARDEAETANRAKSEFLSRMSHELRTPLNAIVGFGRLLQADPALAAGERQRGWLHETLRAADHLLELINELLDLARIEAGQLPLHPSDFDVVALADECLGLVAPLAQERGVRLAPAAAHAPVRVRADRLRLKQVLLNLLSNAVKHIGAGGHAWLAIDGGGAAVRIVVGDDGPGLRPEQRARLFRAFERLNADRAAVDGTGIGLALSKRLVELMHGEIGVDSEAGAGSRFWVQLPRVGGQAPAEVPAAAPQAGLALPALRAATLVYIEDNAINLQLMQAKIELHPQLRLLGADLPEPGLALVHGASPDLVLLDIQLPGIDGYEVLRLLRADPATASIPVLAVSAYAMPADIERGLAAGFDDYLTKPFDLHRLFAALPRWLADAPARDEPRHD
jgi:PAS domain S-box-containing protein